MLSKVDDGDWHEVDVELMQENENYQLAVLVDSDRVFESEIDGGITNFVDVQQIEVGYHYVEVRSRASVFR